jgi:hypothetical protein
MSDELTALEKEIEASRLQALEQLAEADRRKTELAEYRRLKAKFESPAQPNNPDQTAAEAPLRPQTLEALAESYFDDKRSPIHRLRFRTRKNYSNVIKAIVRQHGSLKLTDIKAVTIQTIYDGWNAAAKVSMAHAKVTMLRLLYSYGRDVLKDPECERLSFVLHRMHFARSKTQNQQGVLTQEDVAAIIKKAHEMRLPSFALAQALQYECRKLRQKDIVGEWVPISEQTPPSDIFDKKKKWKWVRGIRWNNLKENLVLHHTLCWEGTEVDIDLRKAPMVMAELDKIKQRLGSLPTRGPVIVYDKTGLPWDDDAFRKKWRVIADSVGISKNVKNADSRTGRRRRSRSPEEKSENDQPTFA